MYLLGALLWKETIKRLNVDLIKLNKMLTMAAF